MAAYRMPDCPPVPRRLAVTAQGQRFALGGNHHGILFIDRAELQAAFGDPWYDSYDEDPDPESPVGRRSDHLTYSGFVAKVGLRVFRESIFRIPFWYVGCALPLGRDDRGVSYQDWSKRVVERLCPSVVFGVGAFCPDRPTALANAAAWRERFSEPAESSGAGR